MKAAKFISRLLVLAGFAALAIPGVYAQSEVNPGQFDSPNTERFPQPNTVIVIVNPTHFTLRELFLKRFGADRTNQMQRLRTDCGPCDINDASRRMLCVVVSVQCGSATYQIAPVIDAATFNGLSLVPSLETAMGFSARVNNSFIFAFLRFFATYRCRSRKIAPTPS